MKRILIVLMLLLSMFFIAWGVKAKTPINRPSNLKEEQESPWYENRYTAPKADEEWYLDPEIPLNYIPVPGEDELYMVVNDSGKITGYRHRTKQADGTWVWEDINPDIPDNYEKVDGLKDVYKVTGKDGQISYVKYVRNEDDTFCFVPVDKKGVPLDDGKDAEKISKEYIHVDGNVYAVYNDDNVKMGYRERVKKGDSYIWKACEAPKIKTSVGNGRGTIASKSDNPLDISQNHNPNMKPNNTQDNVSSNTSSSKDDIPKKQNNDGTYTTTEKTTSTETKNGYIYTYQTTVYSTYDSSGNLIRTKKEGPYEISKKAIKGSSIKADKKQIASTLDGELSRLNGSVDFNISKANEILSKLNAERKNQGLAPLNMNSESESYKLACIRAADMALYDHSSSNSPLYGSLADMVARFNCRSTHPSENIWKASTKSASQIHTRFQTNEGSRKIRMNSYSQVGIAVVENNNQTYIAEIYLK